MQTEAASPTPKAAAAKQKVTASSDNPLLVESTLPYKLPPFDKIKNEHFAPAYAAALAEHMKEVEEIANQEPEATFENTLVAMERAGQTLERVDNVFGNLAGAHTNPEIQKLEAEMAPKLSAHRDAIRLNSKLFARIRALHDKREQLKLDPESKYLLERYYKDFVRAGAKLSEAEKEKLKAMNAELATLQTKFS